MGKKRAILIVLIIAVLAGGAASYLRGGDGGQGQAESVRTSNTGGAYARATSTDSLVAEITATIYQIDRLQLDPSIFNSAAFRVLKDGTQIIPPEVPGRDNPFAPLYSDGVAATSSRQSRPSGSGGLINSAQSSGPAGASSAGTAPALPTR